MHGAPLRLRCEYLANPLGIDVSKPRLSWWINDQRPAEIQTAYRILAARDPESLKSDRGDLWDSGRVEGRQTLGVEYVGEIPPAGSPVWWKVRSYDSDGLPSPWSEPASFEAATVDSSGFRGQWITAPQVGSKTTAVPVPLFNRAFDLTSRPRTARLRIAVLGAAAVQINGTRVAEEELIGGWVDFHQRIEFHSFDVTDLLVEGANSISVLLADGWYAGAIHADVRQQYGQRPALLAQLDVTLLDDTQLWVGTDRRWQWRASWILAADPVRGESVDGRRVEDDWSICTDADDLWLPVLTVAGLSEADPRLGPTLSSRVKRTREIPGELMDYCDLRRRAIYRFPRPLLGRAQVWLKAPQAAVLRIRYGLSLDSGGELCGPCSEDLYTTRGLETGEWFEATFATHGFQYVELSGDLPGRDAATISACALRRDLAVCGEFLSDHAQLNQLFADIAGQQRRFAQVVPLRGLAGARRVGATAEFGAGAGALLHNLDASTLCLKWLQDMADAQLTDGGFPGAVPPPPASESLCGAGGAPHADAFVDVLWNLYRHTGDLRALQRFYPVVRRFLAGLEESSPQHIRADGDSADPDLPADVRATAWFYRSTKLAAKIAGVLGKLADLEDFEELAAEIRSAFRRRFVTAEGRVVGDSLAAYAITLGFGLLEAGERDLAARQLFVCCERLLADPDRIDMPAATALLPTLTSLGRVDLAYRLLLGVSEATPAGDGNAGDRAEAHVQRLIEAGVGDWLYRSVAGFDFSRDVSEAHNAFRMMRIQPLPPLGGAFSGYGDGPPVRAVDAALDTVNGRYEVRWQIGDDAFELTVLVPANCEAVITLPDDTRHDVDAGMHSYRVFFGEAGDGIPILREVG